MSVKEVKGKPGWFNVRVYDHVQNRGSGEKPRPVDRRVKGKTAALNVERDLLNQRDRGSLIGRKATLSAYAAAWLHSRRAEVSRQTLYGYTAYVERYIDRHAIGSKPIAGIDVTTVSDFYADLLSGEGRDTTGEDDTVTPAAPISPDTVRGVHRVLSMVLKRATVDGLLYANPCAVAKPPKDDRDDGDEEEDVERGLDPVDAARLLAALEGTEVHRAAALAVSTGLRRSEFLALRWVDVDLTAKQLRVNGKLEEVGGIVERSATKTIRSRRTVPFSDAVVLVLKTQKAWIAECELAAARKSLWLEEGWVFPCVSVSLNKACEVLPAGRVWTPSAFAQAWRRARDVANGRLLGEYVYAGGEVGDFEPLTVGVHALRHTYATMQLRVGVRDEVVSRRLGHSSSLITRRVYSHATQDELREGVDVTDAALGQGEVSS